MPALNPMTSTREDFTNNLMRRPEGASPEWLELLDKLQPLFDHLAHHDAMVATGNLSQKFMEPAKSKNRVYFMWDFVGRTLAMLFNINPAKTKSQWTAEERELFSDFTGRSVMAAGLILDDKPGFLNSVVESTYPGQSGTHPEFGEEILSDARRIMRK